jgi:hypothetical protein
MIRFRTTIALAALGLLAFALRVSAVLAMPSVALSSAEPHAGALLWLQCVAGTALVLGVAWLGWSLLPGQPSVGWMAGLLAAGYPPHVAIVTQPGPEIWLALVLIVLLAVIAAPQWQATARGAVAAGWLAGLLLLLAPPLAWLLPICLLAFWWAEGNRTWLDRFTRAAFGRLGLMTAVASLIVLAAVAGNRLIYGQFALVGVVSDRVAAATTGPLAPAFAQGERDVVLPSASAAAIWETAAQPAQPGLETDVPASHVPWRAAAGPLRRLQSLLLFDRSVLKTTSRLCVFAMVAWLVLTLVGLSASCHHWREFWPTYAVFGVMIALQTIGAGFPALRTALEPMTLVWVSAAMTPLLVHFAPRQQIRIYRQGEQCRDPFSPAEPLQGPHFGVAAVRRRAG